jgi:hypothetical protein
VNSFNHGEEIDMTQLNENLNAEQQAEKALDEIISQDRVAADKFARKARWSRWVFRMYFLLALLGLIGLAGAVGWTYRANIVQDWDRYGSHQSNCIFKVGERTVKGTRDYSYRYYTILNWKFYDTTKQTEETRIDISGNGMTILAHMPDGTSKKQEVSDGERYNQRIEIAESYSFFMDNGKNAATISYKTMCK